MRARLVATVVVATVSLAAMPAQVAASTFYVSATAKAGGDGSRGAPVRVLGWRSKRQARRGDRIVVLRSPRSAPALDGGIKLKPNQSLVGAGPSVLAKTPRRRAPRITNTDAERHAGDAVRLAAARRCATSRSPGPSAAGSTARTSGA